MESMADYEAEINQSMKEFKEGDRMNATVLSVSEDEITLDLGTYFTGVVYPDEYSDDPHFHAMDSVRTGDTISVVVLDKDDGQGRVVMSLKEGQAADAWETLRLAYENRTILQVKVDSEVNAGVIAYVEGIRGFIPASQLALEYVEDTSEFVGKKLSAIVITVDEEHKKLVLSAKEVAKEEAARAHEGKLNALQKGFVTEGVIERIENYGCFVRFGDDLTGLVHISQICGKFLKSPNEVVKLGQTVKVKVMDVTEDGKIKLSMKEAEDVAPEYDAVEEGQSIEYSDDSEATTSLAALLKDFKFD